MSDDTRPHHDPEPRTYPEDERLRAIEENPDRTMTRKQWEHEDSQARQAAHARREQTAHDRQVQREFDKKKKGKQRHWGKIFLWVGGGILILVLVFLAAWIPKHKQNKKNETEAKQRDLEEPKVDVVQVKRSSAPGLLTVPGTTAPLVEAYIYARANGYLSKLYVDIGDHVRKGQLLALIDAPDLDQQVAQARQQLRQAEAQQAQQQAQLDLTRVTAERWRVLVAKGVFSRQDGDQHETDYHAQIAVVASAERNVESYRANLARVIALQSYERVTAPFDGVVTQRNIDQGGLVGASGAASSEPANSPNVGTGGSASVGASNTSGSSGSPNTSSQASTGQSQGGALFAVAKVDKLRILVSVPEGYATEIHKGMSAQVFVQEQSGHPIPGTVARAAESIDQNSRTMLVEVDLDNSKGTLYPGMYTIVSFVQVRGIPPLTIPGDAVVVRKDKTTVAIIQDMKVHLLPVEIGRDYGPSVEILSGLREGQWVVTSVNDGVQEGAKVRPQQTAQAGEDAGGSGGAQSNKLPDSGPNQYGDQSVVNQQTENSTQKGKGKPPQGGADQKSGGKPSDSKSSGKDAPK